MTSPIENIASILNQKHSKKSNFALSVFIVLSLIGLASIVLTIYYGLGLWGISNEAFWGISIVNFVYWIGIAHAGTLISAILLLFNQKWRSSIHRIAETSTIIAVICAELFPLLHTGRPWFALYWLFPYPNQMGIWVNFRSPLIWDYFAILSYFIVSLLFWYLSLIPDLFLLKNKVHSKFFKKIYSFFSASWIGSTSQWSFHNKLYILFAGLATALVISLHSIVSLDFAVTLQPGWHLTLFPPYFVAGAIFSGCALLIIILNITNYVYELNHFITEEQFEKINKVILATSLIITFSYLLEIFYIFYNGNELEKEIYSRRICVENSVFFILMIFSNSILPNLYWSKRLRKSRLTMLIVSIFICVGMWLERYLIILPVIKSNWLDGTYSVYSPTLIELLIFIGAFGFFCSAFILFTRILPAIPIYERLGKDN